MKRREKAGKTRGKGRRGEKKQENKEREEERREDEKKGEKRKEKAGRRGKRREEERKRHKSIPFCPLAVAEGPGALSVPSRAPITLVLNGPMPWCPANPLSYAPLLLHPSSYALVPPNPPS